MIEIQKMSEEEKARIERIKTIRVSELVAGNPIFESYGISRIKITKDSGNGPEEIILEIPIQSTGVSEMIDEFSREEPKPPVVTRLVLPNSEIGKDLGLTRKKHVQIYDLTDENYRKQKDAHDRDLGLKVALLGISIPIKDENGNVVTDEKRKLEILRSMGLTGGQFSKLVADIQNLTTITEEQTDDFLP